MSDSDDGFFDNASNPFRDEGDALATSQQHHTTTSGATSAGVSINPGNKRNTVNSTAAPPNNDSGSGAQTAQEQSDLFGASENPFGDGGGGDDVFGEESVMEGSAMMNKSKQGRAGGAESGPLSLSGGAVGGGAPSSQQNRNSPPSDGNSNTRLGVNANKLGTSVRSDNTQTSAQSAVSQGMMNMDFAAGLFTPDRVVTQLNDNDDDAEESKIPNLPLDQLPIGSKVWVCNKRDVKLLAQSIWTNEMLEYCASGAEGTIQRYLSNNTLAHVAFTHRGIKGIVRASYSEESEEERKQREEKEQSENPGWDNPELDAIATLTFPRAALALTPPPKPLPPKDANKDGKDDGMRFGLDPKGAPSVAKRLKNEYVVMAPTKKVIKDPMAPRPKNKPRRTLEDVKQLEAEDRQRGDKVFLADFDRATFLQFITTTSEEYKKIKEELTFSPDDSPFFDDLEFYKRENMKKMLVTNVVENENEETTTKKLIAEVTLAIFFPSTAAEIQQQQRQQQQEKESSNDTTNITISVNNDEESSKKLQDELFGNDKQQQAATKKRSNDLFDDYLIKMEDTIDTLKKTVPSEDNNNNNLIILYLYLLIWKIHLIRNDIEKATSRELVVNIVHGISNAIHLALDDDAHEQSASSSSNNNKNNMMAMMEAGGGGSPTADDSVSQPNSPNKANAKNKNINNKTKSLLPPDAPATPADLLAVFNFFSALNNGLPSIQRAIDACADSSSTAAFNLKFILDKSSYARTGLLCDRYVVQGDELARHSGAPFCIPIELADQPHCANCGSITTPHLFLFNAPATPSTITFNTTNNDSSTKQTTTTTFTDPTSEGTILQSALCSTATPRRNRKEFQKQLFLNSTNPRNGSWVTCPRGTDLLFCSGHCAENAWNSFLRVERAGKDYGRAFRSLYFFLQNQALQFSDDVRAALVLMLRCLSLSIAELRYPAGDDSEQNNNNNNNVEENETSSSSSLASKLWHKLPFAYYRDVNDCKNNNNNNDALSTTDVSSTSSGFGSYLMMNHHQNQHSSQQQTNNKSSSCYYTIRSNPTEVAAATTMKQGGGDDKIGAVAGMSMPSKSVTTNPPDDNDQDEMMAHRFGKEHARESITTAVDVNESTTTAASGLKETDEEELLVENNFLPAPRTNWTQLEMLTCFAQIGVYPPPQNAQIEGDMVKVFKNTIYPSLCEIFYEDENHKASSSDFSSSLSFNNGLAGASQKKNNNNTSNATTTVASVASRQKNAGAVEHKHVDNDETIKFTEEIAMDLFIGCFEYARIVEVCPEASNLLHVDSESTTPNTSPATSDRDDDEDDNSEEEEKKADDGEEDQEEENNNDTTIKKPPPKIKKRRFAILSPLATFNLYESDRHEITKLFHRVNTRPEDPEEDAKPILFHQNTNCRFKLFPNGDISLVVDSQQNHHHHTTSIDEDKKKNKNNKNSKTKNNKNNSKKCTNQQFAVPQLTPLSVAM